MRQPKSRPRWHEYGRANPPANPGMPTGQTVPDDGGDRQSTAVTPTQVAHPLAHRLHGRVAAAPLRQSVYQPGEDRQNCPCAYRPLRLPS
jgi:hypothetical protein